MFFRNSITFLFIIFTNLINNTLFAHFSLIFNTEKITVQFTNEPDYDEGEDEGNIYIDEDENEEISPEENFDENDENIGAFQFNISDPSKNHEGKTLSFWIYKISSKTTLTSFKNQINSVRRRYSHFLWLRNQLLEDYPGCIVPPLPEKSLIGAVEKYVSTIDTKNLLQYRQRSLTKFLARVGEHNELQQSSHLQAFLEMKFNEFEEYRKKLAVERKKSTGLTWFKKSLTPEPKFVTEQKKFVIKLEESLKLLKLKLQEMVKKRREMSASIGEFGKAFKNLGLVEKGYEDGNLSTSLIELSNQSDQISLCVLSQAEKETMQVVETISYYLGMCDAMKKLMKKLEVLRLERDDLSNTLNNSKTSLEKLKKANTTELKLKQAEDKIIQLEDKLKTADELLQTSEKCFKNDIERFDLERKVDFAFMLHAFVAIQIEHSEDLKKNWEILLPSIQSLQEA